MCFYKKNIFNHNSPKNKIKRTKNVLFVISIIFLIFILYIAFNIYYFSQVFELTNADAALILGASVWDDKPSPVFQERINHGIWLYKNGYVKYLIFTGGIGKNSNFSEAFVAKNYAINNSVPAENIFTEEKSRITLENIVYAKSIITKNNFTKIILVSDPLHMKRSMVIAKDFGLNVISSPTPTTKFISVKTKLLFLLYEIFFFFIYLLHKHIFIISLYLLTFEILYLYYKHNCA